MSITLSTPVANSLLVYIAVTSSIDIYIFGVSPSFCGMENRTRDHLKLINKDVREEVGDAVYHAGNWRTPTISIPSAGVRFAILV